MKADTSAMKGFVLDTHTYQNLGPKSVQDSAKENYLLCSSCEEYLSVIEGIVSDTFKNWPHMVTNGEYERRILLLDTVDIVRCHTLMPGILTLFVYSLFWRAGASSHPICADFSLNDRMHEFLRVELVKYKHTTKKDFISGFNDGNTLGYAPVMVATADKFTDGTANVIFVPKALAHSGSFISDRYAFSIFESTAHVPEAYTRIVSNSSMDSRICIFNDGVYRELFVDPVIKLFADVIKENQSPKS